jgi:hypothetical protein
VTFQVHEPLIHYQDSVEFSSVSRSWSQFNAHQKNSTTFMLCSELSSEEIKFYCVFVEIQFLNLIILLWYLIWILILFFKNKNFSLKVKYPFRLNSVFSQSIVNTNILQSIKKIFMLQIQNFSVLLPHGWLQASLFFCLEMIGSGIRKSITVRVSQIPG